MHLPAGDRRFVVECPGLSYAVHPDPGLLHLPKPYRSALEAQINEQGAQGGGFWYFR